VADRQASFAVTLTNATTAKWTVSLAWTGDCFAASPPPPVSIDVKPTGITAQTVELMPTCGSGLHTLALIRSTRRSTRTEAIGFDHAHRNDLGGDTFFFRFFYLVAAFLKTLAIPAALALPAYFLNPKADEIKNDRDERDARLRQPPRPRTRSSSAPGRHSATGLRETQKGWRVLVRPPPASSPLVFAPALSSSRSTRLTLP
jgi:hypothetical protein